MGAILLSLLLQQFILRPLLTRSVEIAYSDFKAALREGISRVSQSATCRSPAIGKMAPPSPPSEWRTPASSKSWRPKAQVDVETRRLVKGAGARAWALLVAHRAALDRLARRQCEQETLNADEIAAILSEASSVNGRQPANVVPALT